MESLPKSTIRFFDSNSLEDVDTLTEIVRSPGAREWMADIHNMKKKHFYEWMDEKGRGDQFLFAVVLTDANDPEYGKPQGFVYVYPSDIERKSLEVSFAKKPGAQSGLIYPALKQACLKVMDVIARKDGRKAANLRIIAEIESDNEASMRVVEKAGFEDSGKISVNDNTVWVLNWASIS